jgi:hypothetical protein
MLNSILCANCRASTWLIENGFADDKQGASPKQEEAESDTPPGGAIRSGGEQ